MAGGPLMLAAMLDRLIGEPAAGTALPAPTPLPEGAPVVWLLCPDAAAVQSLGGLLLQIEETLPRAVVMVTGPGADLPDPGEDRRNLRSLLAERKPAVLVLVGTPYRPLAVAMAAERGVPVIGLSLRASQGSWMHRWWARPLTRRLLDRFDRLLCEDAAAESALHRAGAPAERVELGGLLAGDVEVPHCNEHERESVASLLSSRPVWCAVNLPVEELPMILAAHRSALQRAHRLMLILLPADPADGPRMRDVAHDAGWAAGLRSDGDDPEEDFPVYVADLPGELGLWLRAAPTSWMGGTLSGGSLASPVDAAALGSAILHGPSEGAYRTEYARLHAAGAARVARGADEIAQEVERLLAPDAAAEMAHAAWAVMSAGDEAAARGVEALRRILSHAA